MLLNVKGLLFWAAFVLSQTVYGQVTFVIESLPKATPPNDTLYISGSFNGWKTDDPSSQLKKRLDGKYEVTLPAGTGTIEYKFTRGAWSKTETTIKNEHRPNRTYTYGSEKVVYVDIENWQDLGGAQPFDFFALYFFAIAFQGAICLFLLYRIKNYDYSLIKPLSWWIGIISLLLLGRGIYEIVSANWQVYLSMIGQVLVFTTGPLLFFIGKEEVTESYNKKLLHFLPALIILILQIMKVSNFTPLQFLSHPAFGSITIEGAIFHGAGIIHNLIYLTIFSLRHHKNCVSLATFGIVTSGLILLSWFLNFYLIAVGWHHFFLLKYDLPLLLLSLQVLALTWLVIKKPDFFKTKERVLPIPEIDKIKEDIHRIMETEKPYRKSDLSLNELAEIVNIKPHYLSKIINEGFNYNFRDFVNKYRIEEFIHHINSEKYKNYTYLAVAYEVGFNAKSTFNVAFKRFTQTTPREYFKKDNKLKIKD